MVRSVVSARHAVFLLALALVPGAVAEPLDGRFQTTGTTHLDGDLDLRWDVAGAFLTPPAGVRLTVHVEDATLAYVNLPREFLHIPTPGDPETIEVQNEEQPVWNGTGTGTLHFTSAGASEVRVLPAAPLHASTQGPAATIAPAGTPWADPYGLPLENVGVVAGVDTDPRPGHTLADVDGPVRFEGPIHLFLAGGEARWDDRTFHTGFSHDDDASARDPVTGSGREVRDNHVLVVTARAAHVDLEGDRWTLAATHLAGSVEGAIEWRGLHGTPSLNGSLLPDGPDALRAEGHLETTSDLRGNAASWNLAGDATTVQVDRVPVLEASTAAATAALVSLLLLLEPLRAALADLLGRLVPLRLRTRDGDGARRAILAAVHAHQPIRLRELDDETGLGRSTLRYHLRVLQRQGVLEAHTPAGGRNRTYMLNGGSLRFRCATRSNPDGPGVPAAATLGAAHGHPVRRAILERVLEGPADADALLQHLDALDRPVARSTLSHHLRTLVEAGAVTARRAGGRKWYHPDLDVDGVRLEQYRRYFTGHGLLALATALDRPDGLDADAVDALVRGVPGAPRPHDLVTHAILEERGGRLHLAPALRDLARRLRRPAA